jgi:hypothetical protein
MLSENPFYILSVGPSAKPEDVEDAYGDALSDGLAQPQQLQTARQALVNPKLRLAAEVSYLPDVERKAAQDVQSALHNGDTETLLKIATKLHALPRSNVLAHVYAQLAIDSAQLSELVRLQSQVAPGATADAINDARQSAGLVKVDAEVVRDALQELFDRQSKSILLGLRDPGQAAAVISAATEELLACGDKDALEGLQRLLDSYGRWIDTSLSAIQEAMKAADARIRSRHPDPEGIAQVVRRLSEATHLLRPLQIVDHAKGRDEPRSRIAYDSIHTLALWLGNEKNDFRSALLLLEGARPHFTRLPRAEAEIAQSIETLAENDAFRKLAPLIEQVGDAKDNPKSFASDLSESGFGLSSRGRAKSLFLALSGAVLSVRSGTVAELPWRMVQQLAVGLNNDHDNPEAALSLLDGCLSLATKCPPPKEILEVLRRDKAKVSYLVKQKGLLVLVKRRDIAGALRLIDSLMPDATGEDAEFLTKTKASLEAQKHSSGGYGVWIVLGLIGLGIFIAAQGDAPSRSTRSTRSTPAPQITTPAPQPPVTPRSTHVPSPAPKATPSQHASFEEMPHPGGADRVLSAANIRYCLHQRARLNAVRATTHVHSPGGTDRFNQLIDQWNARCGAYRYEESDMESARQSQVLNSERLKKEGEEIAQTWSKLFPRPDVVDTFPGGVRVPPGWQTPPVTNEAEPSPRVAADDRGSGGTTRGNDAAGSPWSTPSQTSRTDAVAEHQLCASRTCDLLRVDEARRVQGRLVELGYMIGAGDGQWGSRSRAALRSFRVVNGLGADDAWDLPTQDRLFSAQAKASSIRIDIPATIGTPSRYPPPPDATLNPLNKSDASRVQKRLAQLGYYRGSGDGDWGPASRSSLQDFKVAHGLSNDDGWDSETERILLAGSAVRINETAFGTWSAHGGACGSTAPASRVSISSTTVDLFGRVCSVSGVKRSGSRWSYDLLCGSDGQERTSAIFSVREGSLYRLGVGDRVPYARCS